MSAVQDKALNTLTGLGLTLSQAKVYLALAKAGDATVKDAAKTSKVVRQDVYRIVAQLHDLGLVEKLITTPTRFNAIPIDAAVSALIQRRNLKSLELQQEASELLQSCKSMNDRATPQEDESKFIIVKDLQARLKKLRKQIDDTEKSIKIVTRWSFFRTFTLETAEEHAKALSRGVTVQIVTQKPAQAEPLPKKMQALLKHPNFQIRYVPGLPSSIIAVFDKREVNISILSQTQPSESPFLLSNNPCLIVLAQSYFDITWLTSLENAKQKLSDS